jgi:hypothetical protein
VIHDGNLNPCFAVDTSNHPIGFSQAEFQLPCGGTGNEARVGARIEQNLDRLTVDLAVDHWPIPLSIDVQLGDLDDLAGAVRV